MMMNDICPLIVPWHEVGKCNNNKLKVGNQINLNELQTTDSLTEKQLDCNKKYIFSIN